MKYKLKRKLKKIGTFFLALLTLFSSLFGGMAGMPAPVVNVAAKEGTATVGMSQVMDCNKISALNRPASEGLWKITANGKGTFCLNSGKSMCNGDTVKYKIHNAVTYKNQGVAKALTYYYWKSPKNTKAFALTQAYIWARQEKIWMTSFQAVMQRLSAIRSRKQIQKVRSIIIP